MPQHFAQLSDPHLTSLDSVRTADLLDKRGLGYLSWRRKRRFEHRREVLDALLDDLQQQPPEQVLVTGDLTHVGLPCEFAEAREWLHTLGDADRVALVPGNHDACVPAAWEDTFALWRDYMASDGDAGATGPVRFPTLRVRGELAFIGLSTAVPKPPLMATGTLGRSQIERLEPLLESCATRGLFRVVYLHHCPLARVDKWRKRLTDATAVQQVLARQGAELVVHGHGHRGHFARLRTRHGVAPVIAVPSASAMGLHGHEAAAYHRYAVTPTPGGWRLQIEPRRYDTVAGVFTQSDGYTVEIDRRRMREAAAG